MSQSGLSAEGGVAWPSNGISEVPFRVYTDQDQYAREQERLFKGPTWNYLCLAIEVARLGDYVATTVGETAVIVVRDAAGGINAFVNRCSSRLWSDPDRPTKQELPEQIRRPYPLDFLHWRAYRRC